MPSEQDHRTQEARNWAFYRTELGGRNAAYCEWAVTAIFYAAVHKVEAFLRRNHVPPSGSHRERKASLRGLRRLRAIATLEKLETASREARYGCKTSFTPQDLDEFEEWADLDLTAELS